MILHFSYKLTKTPDLEKAVEQQIQKLRKRLQIFRPELVSLNGTVDEGAKNGTVVSLNLHLPSGQLAAQQTADRPVAAIKAAFDGLIEQLTKHKDLLRSEYKWPRTRGVLQERPLEQVPFEDTIAAVKSDKISDDDVSSYVNLNLPRLQRYVERELRYREASGRLRGRFRRTRLWTRRFRMRSMITHHGQRKLRLSLGCIGWQRSRLTG